MNMKLKIAVNYVFEDGSQYIDIFRPFDEEPEYECGSWRAPFENDCPALGHVESLEQGEIGGLISKHGDVVAVAVRPLL